MVLLLFLLILNLVNISSDVSWSFDYGSDLVFHAYLFEHEQRIFTHPQLSVKLSGGSKLCQLHLLPTSTHDVPSFISARVTDRDRGYGELSFNSTALYEDRLHGQVTSEASVYNLKIVAEDCSHPARISRPWSINVILVPTEYPIWSQPHYTFNIPSTLPAGDIVGKVTGYAALDFDSSQRTYQLGDDTGMCAYAIDHPASNLFDINGHGVIRSRVRFTETNLVRHDINVTGFDCHAPVPRRSTVPVTVVVQPTCIAQWREFDDQMAYPALSGAKPLSTSATLELCEAVQQVSCEISEVVSRVKLLWTTKHPSQVGLDRPSSVCDLDLLSLRAQRRSCGFSVDSATELLPLDANEIGPVLQRSDHRTSVQHFNGSFHWVIPDSVLPLIKHRLDNIPFTLTFWMNHSVNPSRTVLAGEFNGKEHIVCSADSDGKNRHHFAVFLHNCKLTTLLRREPVLSTGLNHLYPSQWRFAVDEVCDNDWHHYALVYQPPSEEIVNQLSSGTDDWRNVGQLELYVDGELVPPDSDLVDVAEDIPMRPLKRLSQATRISVGACWHSGTGQHVQHFTGQLAGLVLSRNVMEPGYRLQCLTSCLPRIHLLGQATGDPRKTAVSPLYQSATSSLVVNATSLEKMANLIRKVVYYNPRIYNRPECRLEPIGIHISTTIQFGETCPNVSKAEKMVQILHLPLNKQAQSLLNYGPVTIPSRIVGTDSLVEPSIDESYSLLLKLENAQDGLTITEVFEASLYQGVWVFPSVDLYWKMSDHHGPYSLDPDDFASFCEVDLCDSAGYLLLQPHENLNISTEFLPYGLRFEKYGQGFRLHGPAKLVYLKTALQHIRWYNSRPSGMHGRCFQLNCVADLETIHRDGSTIQLKVKSNTVHSVLRIRYLTPVNTEPKYLDYKQNDQHASILLGRTSEYIAQRQHAPRVLRDLTRHESSDITSEITSENPSQVSNYPLIIVAVVMVGMLLTIVGIILYSRLRSAQQSLAYEPQWEPVDTKPLVTTSATKQRQCGTRGRLQVVNPLADALQLTVNPVTHPKELEDINRKFCFYDPKIYDGETLESRDEMEMSSDMNEDLSDFEGVSRQEQLPIGEPGFRECHKHTND